MRAILIMGAIGFLFRPWLQASDMKGNVEIGGQAVRGDTGSSKFDEYIDVPRGSFVESLELEVSTEPSACYLNVSAFKPGFKDQRFEIESGQWGKHRMTFTYDQIPHNFSNTAQTFLQDRGDGLFTLSDNMQSSLQTSTTNAPGFFSDTPFVPLRVDRRRGSLSYVFNPVGSWRTSLGYSAEKKEGDKALGVTYGHGQIEEALEPVDYQTHDIRLQTEYESQTTGFKMGYAGSFFHNGIKALTLDNPFQLDNGALSSSGASTPGTARLALPPDNQTHQLNASFATQTNSKSRLATDFSFAVQRQNEAFLPFTSNVVILNDPRLPPLPQSSLDGLVHTLNANARWNWKATEKLSINLRGRHYDINNKTPSLLFDQYVQYDTNMSTGTPTSAYNPTRSRRSLPLEYAKTTFGADAYYPLAKGMGLKLDYNHEILKRHFREAEKTHENIYTFALNVGPYSDFVVRPSYQFARRTPEDYSAERVAEESFPLGEGTSLGQLDALRKFDEAGRDRNNVSVRADWDPLDYLNVGLDYGLIRDDFKADYGALDGKTHYYSVDFSVNPSQGWSFYSDYTWEQMTLNTRSRYRATGVDLEANDWSGHLQDTVHTFDVGTQCDLIQDKMDVRLDWNLSYAKGVQQATNPNTITTVSAAAIDLPDTYNRLSRIR
ncbi:MAG: MtrB/PioB family decaheme-associated outer membrane protein, partial [Elusimicrobia bacterium]|nr:MtrB/PioB family decaheme-associated outer membrane protein [Elusimicrobiota bacterium]